ncbi:MAG TPA: transposase [Kofleriaceae bacterium]
MGASALKRHRQLGLFNAKGRKADQRIGKARGGRPRKTLRGSAPHRKRVLDVRSTWPVHVVLRVVDDVVGLRKRSIYKALRAASLSALRQHDDSLGGGEAARIIHFSIQRSHIHLIVETPSQTALSKGIQGFKISAAKHINRVLGQERGERRRGAVFSERYVAEVIKTPRQARNTLAYVLRGSIKTTIDGRSRSGDLKMCLWSPRSALARFAVEFVVTRSLASRSIAVDSSTLFVAVPS